MKLILLIVSLLSTSAFAAGNTTDPDGIYCKTFVYNDVQDKFVYGDLKVAKYDDKFLEGTIGNYGMGADKYFIKSDDALGLVINDHTTHNGTYALGGWKTVGKTQMMEIDLFVVLKDKSRDQVQITCYRDL